MMLEDLVRLVLADAALVFGSFTALWAVSMVMRDSSLVDIWFSPCIALAAIMGVFVAHGAEPRRELVAVLATGALLGGAGVWLTGSPNWWLAVPAALATAWMFLSNPLECQPQR